MPTRPNSSPLLHYTPTDLYQICRRHGLALNAGEQAVAAGSTRPLVRLILEEGKADADMLTFIILPVLKIMKETPETAEDWFWIAEILDVTEPALSTLWCPIPVLTEACLSPHSDIRYYATQNPNCPEESRIMAALLG